MRWNVVNMVACGLIVASGIWTFSPTAEAGQAPGAEAASEEDPVKELVGRLNLENYKATVLGLTEFGDRRQGTDRNRAAIDWIEAQLESYGCPTGRIQYEHNPPPRGGRGGNRVALDPVIDSGEIRSGPGGSRYRGITRPTGVNNDPEAQPDETLRELNRQPTTPGSR